jgi:hypothetical protein
MQWWRRDASAWSRRWRKGMGRRPPGTQRLSPFPSLEAEELADLEMNMGASAAMNAYVVRGRPACPHTILAGVKAASGDPPAHLFLAGKWRPI